MSNCKASLDPKIFSKCNQLGSDHQPVQSSNWFTSFDLTQEYLQLAMEKDDIKKTTFRAGLSGLIESPCLTFDLSNTGSSF